MLQPLLILTRAFLVAIVIALTVYATSPAKEFDDSEVMPIGYPEWFKDGFFDLKADLDQALSRNKKGLMVLFTTEGCSYCHVFIRKSLGNPELAALVRKHFDAVGMEIFSDVEMTSPRGVAMRVKQFADEEGVEFSPTLLFYGKDGKRLFRMVGYPSPERFRMILDYVIGDLYRFESFSDYARRVETGAASSPSSAGLKADPLFAVPPYALDRSRFPASRPLLVLFERADCGECLDFHADVLALDEIRNLLRRFEVVRLDAGDKVTPVLTPDGGRTTPASWFRRTRFSRVPALLFFDEKGQQVLSTDALILRQRMMNSCLFVLERAYQKNWTYQRFARSKAYERSRGQ